MAVEVQTWGTLGTMVTEQKEVGAATAEYLEKNEVYDLFGHLLRQVIVHQPANPVTFLQEQLKSRPPLSVCVIGPPGVNRTRYCQQLATDYKVNHIHVGRLLRQKKELQGIIEAGTLVEDQIVIDVVQSELKKARHTGWVLNGFPRTRVQAQTLANKEMGFCLDKILLLNTGEKAIREQYAKKMQTTSLGSSEKEEMINTRLQQYQRHVISIVELFKNVVRQIEVGAGDDDQGFTYNIIKNNLHVRPYSNAPHRPSRICIVGPCASGRSTQCKLVAKQYGLVHVDLAPLIRAHQKANSLTIEDVPPEFLSDEELCGVVGRRLNQCDCLRKGWVLDGFPKTPAQAEFLRQSHLWPTRLVQLRIDEEEVLNRISSRRIDPLTCMAYYRAPNSVAVRQRLVQADFDEPEKVKERIKLHFDNVDRVAQTFPMVSSVVSGNQEITEISKNIFGRLDQPLPTELAQDPESGEAP
jgi:adenylate kinase|mmetsp:Transcript_83062/g.131058  ORF Transcript_83062/g.131058 Transcript_83062/m.131058 type:complete len:468 (-) Transcript_83062:57-1460(-)